VISEVLRIAARCFYMVHSTFLGDGIENADKLTPNGVVLATLHSKGENQHVRRRIVSRDGTDGLLCRRHTSGQVGRVGRFGFGSA
jgi:hypothetical protein